MHRLDNFPKNVLIGQYRNVFSSRNGVDVLNHLLYDLGVFQATPDSPEDIALRNFGLRLLAILGGGEYPAEDTIKQFTKKLMRQPLNKEKEDE